MSSGRVKSKSFEEVQNGYVIAKDKTTKDLQNSFDWITLLAYDDGLRAAPVSSFKYAPISDIWDALVTHGLKVEVKNTDFKAPSDARLPQAVYWIAEVIRIAGYFVLLRYEGYAMDGSKDFWVNIFTHGVHPVGWCASQGKALIPPKSVEEKFGDWKEYLLKRLTGSRTLPENFHEQCKEGLKSRFRPGMKLEVVDKKRISAVRVAHIDKIIGGRLHITYEEAEDEDVGFWCHSQSPLIHPVGWAQLVGHELRATSEYARVSLHKCMNNQFDDDDASWSFFPPVQRPESEQRFQEGMKLEAIDPLNLSTICVATVMKVLRNNYLMIGIDGMMAADGSDYFCYHSTSPCIFPAGFCQYNNLELTKPSNYSRAFDWGTYLREMNATAAPVQLFRKDVPAHNFKEGMYLEAVDLMEPRLVCVATVTKVVGRLLRVHFNGWDDSYDQWCDCESPELFPAGWCQLVGYWLEPPKDGDDSANSSSISMNSSFLSENKQRKRGTYKGRSKRRKRNSTGYSLSSSTNGAGDEAMEEENGGHRAFSPEMPHLQRVEHMDSTAISTSAASSTSSAPLHQRQTATAAAVSTSRQHLSMSELSNSSVVVKPSPVVQPLAQQQQLENDSFLDVSPNDWTVGHVISFLRKNECGSYCQSFAKERINGPRFLQLTHETIMALAGMKVGPALKIGALIKSLHETSRK